MLGKTKWTSQRGLNMYMFFKFNNVTIADVCVKFKSKRSYVIKVLSLFSNNDNDLKPIHLGSKNEAYFTEDEMINGFTKTYTTEQIQSEWYLKN
jgi:hypothetical protein